MATGVTTAEVITVEEAIILPATIRMVITGIIITGTVTRAITTTAAAIIIRAGIVIMATHKAAGRIKHPERQAVGKVTAVAEIIPEAGDTTRRYSQQPDPL